MGPSRRATSAPRDKGVQERVGLGSVMGAADSEEKSALDTWRGPGWADGPRRLSRNSSSRVAASWALQSGAVAAAARG
eukprot:4445353-Pyramimonas_sp.AAC.1